MVGKRLLFLCIVLFSTFSVLFSINLALGDPINVTLLSPTNASFQNESTFNLTYKANMSGNCSTYVWNSSGVLISQSESNVSVLNETNNTFSLNLSNGNPDGTYRWNSLCFNSNNTNNSNWSNSNYTFTIGTHFLYGYVAYSNQTAINGANVSILIYSMPGNQPPILLRTYTVNSGSNGFFNITNTSISNTNMFKVVSYVYNISNPLVVDWIGPSLPTFMLGGGEGPEGNMLSMMQNITLYMKPGATINVSAVNKTGGPKAFQYQIKDTKLGYPVGENFASSVTSALIHVPRNRNYSIMIYPNESFPVSYDIGSSLLEDGYQLKVFNCTDSINNRLAGYMKLNGNVGFDEVTIVSYLLEPGRMIFFGENSWAMSNMTLGGAPDSYNATRGFYNVSFVGPVENASLIMMAVAKNGSEYYGMFKEIKLTYGGVAYPNGTLISGTYNITLQKLVGTDYVVRANGGQGISINMTAMNITLLSGGNPIQQQAHVEIEVDYDDYNSTNFTYMLDVGNSASGVVRVPLLNVTGVDRVNIFSQEASPTKKRLNITQVNAGIEEISLRENMDMKKPDGSNMTMDLFIDMIVSNATCNAPNYPIACSFFGNQQNKEEMNPFKTVMSGASMSFVMKNSDGITVIYTNVDMMASGPPDAVFDENADDKQGTSSFEEVWRFGSTGPEIYDYVIIGVPYTEGSTSQTGFNESKDFNLSIPCLYGEDFDSPAWNGSSNDFNITEINTSEDLKDFRDYVGTNYEFYINSTNGVTCNATDSTLSNGLCYKDTTNNMVWFKIKHFSGLGPSVEGSIITATPPTPPSGGGGGGGPTLNNTTQTNQTISVNMSNMTLNNTLKPGKDLLKHGTFGKGEIRNILFWGEQHSIKVIDIVETAPGVYSVTIEIRSEPITLILITGETRQVDINGDGVNDVSITFSGMNGGKAILDVKELVPANQEMPPVETEKKNLTWLWVLICIAIVIAIAVIVIVLAGRKKDPYKKNYKYKKA